MMKRILIGLFASFLFVSIARASDGQYAVSGISPLLKINANAVIRLEELHFEIKSVKETIEKRHYVITVLNENGDQWAEFAEYYDNLSTIVSAEGFLYDPSGKLIAKVRKKDISDFKAGSGSFIDDGRVKVHNFYQRSYPYTVAYTVERVNKSSLFFPSWTPRAATGISVEKSVLQVTCPNNYEFRHKAFLYNGTPEVELKKNTKITTWSVQHLPAIQNEPFSPVWHEMTTKVLLAPVDFHVGDYKGNMGSWESFGKFFYALNAARDQLPDNIRREVHEITDGINNPIEKVNALYSYMQRNTHYVSIQLGIGGWQPFDAKYVATNRYGDCKALVNYMQSLLREIGITSFYTLVRAGRNAQPVISEFPSQQFNHVILCVPVNQDTVWLECTSQTLPAGYLSDFTADRDALLIDENGGKLVHTPSYGLNENVQTRKIKASLDKNGHLRVIAETVYSGTLQDNIHGLINNLSREKVKEYLHEQLDFATYDINRFDYKEHKSREPYIHEILDIDVSHYATSTGKRLFILPDVMTRSTLRPSGDSIRRNPIKLTNAFRIIDSVEITLQPGYQLESLPSDLELSSAFGVYKSKTVVKNDTILYYRYMEQRKGNFPASTYTELIKFYDSIYKADRNRVVLVKN